MPQHILFSEGSNIIRTYPFKAPFRLPSLNAQRAAFPRKACVQMNEIRTKYLSEYIAGRKGLSIEKQTLSDAFDYTFCGPLPAGGTGEEPLREDILYFAAEEDVPPLLCAKGLKFVILRRDRQALCPSFLSEARLIVCAYEEKEFAAFYERCRTAAAVDAQMGPAVMHLVAMAAQNSSLNELVKYISDVYGSVVSIVDNAYTIMAYARWGELPKEFEEDYMQGYLNDGTVKGLNKINFLTPETAAPEYRYYDFKKALGGSILGYSRNNYSVIFIDGLAVAAVSVFDDYDMEEYKLKYLEVISSVLSGYLQKLEFYSLNRGAYFSHLMSIIISESEFDPQITQRRLAACGYRLNEYMYILAAGLAPFADSPGPADTLGMRLKNVLPNSIYVVMKDRLVFLMSPKEPLGPEDLAKVDQFLRYANVKAGVSDPFKKLGHAKVALAEALEALEIGLEMSPDKNIWLFGGCQFTSIVKKLLACGSDKTISMYLYPPLMELIEYDRKHKTAFADTLREYLRDAKNPRAVCERLFIHKNTLYYRLDKIRQVMAVDYTEQDVQLKITLTFAILEYAERRKGAQPFGYFA